MLPHSYVIVIEREFQLCWNSHRIYITVVRRSRQCQGPSVRRPVIRTPLCPSSSCHDQVVTLSPSFQFLRPRRSSPLSPCHHPRTSIAKRLLLVCPPVVSWPWLPVFAVRESRESAACRRYLSGALSAFELGRSASRPLRKRISRLLTVRWRNWNEKRWRQRLPGRRPTS